PRGDAKNLSQPELRSFRAFGAFVGNAPGGRVPPSLPLLSVGARFPWQQHVIFTVPVTFQDIEAARERIKGAVYCTPCLRSIPLSEITGMQIFCKHDNLQRTGSFKERGARNALSLLPAQQQKRGVIAASAGNHAQALAYQGNLLGIPATVVMPKWAPL